MPRSYDAKTVALSLDVPIKWLDNLLSLSDDFPGVVRARQGVRRRIGDDGLLAIELVRLLSLDLAVPVARAAQLVRAAFASPSPDLRVTTDAGITVLFPVAEITESLQRRVADALESAPLIRRGRPPAIRK